MKNIDDLRQPGDNPPPIEVIEAEIAEAEQRMRLLEDTL